MLITFLSLVRDLISMEPFFNYDSMAHNFDETMARVTQQDCRTSLNRVSCLFEDHGLEVGDSAPTSTGDVGAAIVHRLSNSVQC